VSVSGVRKRPALEFPDTGDLRPLYWSNGEIGRNEIEGPRAFFPGQLSGPVFSVTTDDVEEPGGVRARRDVIRHSGSIVVLAVEEPTRTGRSGAEDPARAPVSPRRAVDDVELPAGRIDDGETAITAAKRELLEETGYRARQWKRILHFYVSPGFLDETMTIYMARGLQAGKAQPEADERIATSLVPCRRQADGAERPHPRCQDDLRHPVAGADGPARAVARATRNLSVIPRVLKTLTTTAAM